MYNACNCVKLVLKLRNFFCLKLSIYICLQYTLHTCSYVCTSRESLNVSSELCNMCLHFSKPPLVVCFISIMYWCTCICLCWTWRICAEEFHLVLFNEVHLIILFTPTVLWELCCL